MIRYKNGQAVDSQNTTISAICVLDAVAEGLRRFKIRVAELKRESGQSGTLVSLLEKALEMQGTETNDARHHLRIQVYENPFACVQLSEAFGTGPWDERFILRDDRVLRVFADSSLAALEADEFAAGVARLDRLGL
jgi:hypothetical protein